MGEQRWLGHEGSLLSGVIALEDVVKYGHYACCETGDGCLYEYEGGTFWKTASGHDASRQLVADLAELPLGPWHHGPFCTCPLCQARPSS
jgi:hypothetical protein